MEKERRLIRLNVGDFLEIRSLDKADRLYPSKSKDFSLMGICFSSEMQWERGQILLIDYFIPEELESVMLKMVVVWSELIDSKNGYFCGGEIVEVEESQQEKFASYYYKKLKKKFLK